MSPTLIFNAAALADRLPLLAPGPISTLITDACSKSPGDLQTETCKLDPSVPGYLATKSSALVTAAFAILSSFSTSNAVPPVDTAFLEESSTTLDTNSLLP